MVAAALGSSNKLAPQEIAGRFVSVRVGEKEWEL